jgi:hypothetical protein
VEVNVHFAVDGHRFAHRLREEGLNVRNAVLRVDGDGDIAPNRLAVSVPASNWRHEQLRWKNQPAASTYLALTVATILDSLKVR